MLFLGLYLVAIGVEGIKRSLPTLGAEQFDENTPKGRKQRSTFFNYFIFCLICGGLIVVTLVLWIEDNVGWQWGFGISTIAILLSIVILLAGSVFYRCRIPNGTPLATMFKVVCAASLNVSKVANSDEQQTKENETNRARLSNTLEWLNRAVENKPANRLLACSIQEVEDVKIMLQILPIFCTIILNCCLAQLSTFSVQQAATMNTMLGSFKVPPASLPVFPIVFLMIMTPLYDHIIIPFARKWKKFEMGVSHLQGIGLGLCFFILAMAVAALVELQRKKVSKVAMVALLPISFLWISFQYLFLGSADLFVLAGLMEFSFTEAPVRMRSLATSFSWASLSMGYFLSGVIVSVVNGVTGARYHRQPWFSGENLNHHHLDRFYWLLCVLSLLNLEIIFFGRIVTITNQYQETFKII
ncbi:unnamed protein product [Lactuca saligna]|uniref:Uncharacterized protein n=1 Tax=Lactuca saligna TaxID=75948 RepID=A0AA35YQN9_LACSI|nr:unnamed protein product [Lactuca saligna]